MVFFVFYLLGIAGTVRMLRESFFPEAPAGSLAWITAGISLVLVFWRLYRMKKKTGKEFPVCILAAAAVIWHFREELREGFLSLYHSVLITAWNHFHPDDLADRGMLHWGFPELLASGLVLFVFACCLYQACVAKVSRVGTLMLLIQPLAAVLAVGTTPSMAAMSMVFLACVGVFGGNEPEQEKREGIKGIWTVVRKNGRKRRQRRAGRNALAAAAAGGVLLAAAVFAASFADRQLETGKLEARNWVWNTFAFTSFPVQDSDGFSGVPGLGQNPGEFTNREQIRYSGRKLAEVVWYEKPQETVYLKNFHGSVYSGHGWEVQKGQDDVKAGEEAASDRKRRQRSRGTAEAENVVEIGVSQTEDAAQRYVPYDSVRMGSGAGRTRYRYYGRDEYARLLRDQKEEPTMSAQERERYLEWPDTLERLNDICMTNPAKDVGQIREFIVSWLAGQCSYNLQVGKYPEDRDPIEYFLFEKHEGYCQHFASAAVMMFRMYGIPARYTTGLAVSKELFQNRDGSSLWCAYPQDSCAHAWAEIWQEGYGWVPVEATPGGAPQNGTPGTDGLLSEQERAEETPRITQEAEEPGEGAQSETPEPSRNAEAPEEEEEISPNREASGTAAFSEKADGVFRTAACALLAVAAAVLFVFVRRWVLLGRKKRKSYSGLFQEMVRLFQKEGLSGEADWLSDGFAEEMKRTFPWVDEKTAAALAGTQAAVLYGNHRATRKEKAALWEFYLAACRNLCRDRTLLQKFRFRLWECWY